MRTLRHFLPLTPTLALALFAGCETRPRAPALTTEAVFTSSGLGLTFVAPDGWAVYAKADPPAGTIRAQPLRYVAYQKTEARRADFEVYLIAPDGGDVMGYLAKQPIGPEKWADESPAAAVTVGGAPARRHHLTSKTRPDMRREITAVPRGDRAVLFVVTFSAPDTKYREQVRRAVESATWK